MSLTVGNALERAFERTFDRDGVLLMVASYLTSFLLYGLGTQEYALRTPLVRVQFGVFLLALLVSTVGSILVAIAALRVFVREPGELSLRAACTRKLGWAVLNLVVGIVVYGLVVGIGFLLLIIPGLFLLSTLAFWNVYVLVEDDNFVEGFSRSWTLTEDNRLAVLLLLFVVGILSAIVGFVFRVVAVPLGPASALLSSVGTAFTTVFSAAAIASAYRQLTGSTASRASESEWDDA